MKSCLIGLGLLLTAVAGCDRFSVQKQLEQYVADQKANGSLPRRISDRLTLVDIQAGDHELIQIFDVKGPREEIEKKRDEMKSQLLTELKRNQASIQNLIQYQVVMTFRYRHAASGEVLHEFQVEPWKDL